MDIGTLLLIAAVLLCPLSMMWMMRKGQGHGGDSGGAAPRSDRDPAKRDAEKQAR